MRSSNGLQHPEAVVMTLDPESYYRHLGRLIEGMPDFSGAPPFSSAVSSLKCNTGLQAHDFSRKDFGWRFKTKTLTRAVV